MDHDWARNALCRDEPPDLWFVEGNGPQEKADAALAKEICGNCTVSAECLDHAGTIGATAGIFGGLSPEERRNLGGRLTVRLQAGR